MMSAVELEMSETSVSLMQRHMYINNGLGM